MLQVSEEFVDVVRQREIIMMERSTNAKDEDKTKVITIAINAIVVFPSQRTQTDRDKDRQIQTDN